MSALATVSKSKGEIDRLIERHRLNRWVSLAPDKVAFAYAWVESFSHITAAREIGRAGTGMKYLRDAETRAFIVHLKEAYEDRRIITEGFVADLLLGMLPKLSGEEEINYIDRGIEGRGKRFDGPSLMRAADLAAKLAGVATKKELSVSGGPALNIKINLGGPANDSSSAPPEKVIEGEKEAEEALTAPYPWPVADPSDESLDD